MQAPPRRALHEEITGTDEAFLVRQRHGGAAITPRARASIRQRRCGGHHPIADGRRSMTALRRAAFGACAGQRVFQFLQPLGSAIAAKLGRRIFRRLASAARWIRVNA